MPALEEWLRTRGDEELVTLLRTRPDLATPPPADSSVLATRVGVRSSVLRACEDLDAFALSTLHALIVLDADAAAVPETTVAELLGADVSLQRLHRTLNDLRERALVWGSNAGLSAVPSVRDAVGTYPGGLGQHKEELTDPDAALSAMDEEERQLVGRLAGESPIGQTKDAAREFTSATARTPVQRLLARNLLIRRDSGTVELPRQLAFAVRGDYPMGRVEPHEPVPELSDPGQDRIDSTSAGEVLELLRHTELLIDAWGTDPPDVLRSGGVGVRELRRTGKALDVDEQRIALIVELAVAAGLIANSGADDPQWVPTVHADSWLASGPENRWSALAQGWMTLPRLPSLVGTRDDKDRPLGPLAEGLRRPSAAAERRRVLTLLAELPSGHGVRGPDEVATVLAWRAPRRGGRLRDALVHWILAEATALGIVALGGLSTSGAALLTDGPNEAAKLLSDALPEPLDHVLVQADLTVVAPGRLEPALAADMNLIADVESAGSATVYRISEGSIRRALDAGRTPEDLHALLRTRSRTPIPQGLTYLIDDVARRHGTLRAGTAAAFVRCDDPVALEEVLANPSVSGLELRRIAPTVLISPLPLTELVDGLRSAGLAPVAEGPDGQVLDLRAGRARIRGQTRQPQLGPATGPDADQLSELVAKVRAGDRAMAARRGSAVWPERGRPSADVTLALLRDAATNHRDVWLGFVDSHGVASQCVVRPTSVGGGILRGIDQGREEAGNFPLHRITSVAVIEDD